MSNIVRVKVTTHRKTGLLVAMSEDLKGLFVHGRNEDELDSRLPDAIRSLLEAKGVCVADVSKIEAEETKFRPEVTEYQAELCDA